MNEIMIPKFRGQFLQIIEINDLYAWVKPVQKSEFAIYLPWEKSKIFVPYIPVCINIMPHPRFVHFIETEVFVTQVFVPVYNKIIQLGISKGW